MKNVRLGKTAKWLRPEFLLIGALLLIGAIAVPAVANVYLVQSVFISLCNGLGIPVR